jgi:hypothetical protein
VADSCDEATETSGSIKGGKFHARLSDYQHFKQYYVSWSWLISDKNVDIIIRHHNL